MPHLAWMVLAVVPVVAPGCTDQAPPQPDTSAVEEPFTATQPYHLAATRSPGLGRIEGLAVDGEGRFYLAHGRGVTVLNAQWTPMKDLPTPGGAAAVAVHADGRIFVALRQKVIVFDASGRQVAAWGGPGGKPGQLGQLTGLAVHGDNVWLADGGNAVVHRFDTSGRFVAEFGLRDAKLRVPGIICPSPFLDCTVAADGTLWTTNPGRWRVEHYDLSGRPLEAWGRQGPGPRTFPGCCNPTNLCLLPGGGFVTSEKGVPRVKVHAEDGQVVAVMGPEGFDEHSAGLDVVADAQGRIYAVDPEQGKVLVFEKAEEKHGTAQ
jgi:sugar lactone lactonase YvrE